MPVLNGGSESGVVLVYGHEGYKYGLIPLLEALLMPLGLGDLILTADELRGLEGEEKLLAILMPLLAALDEVFADPLPGLLKLLPSLAYFTTVKDEGGRTALEQSLNNILFSATSILALLTGDDNFGLSELLSLFGLDFDLDIPKLLDDLIEDLLGIPNLGSTLMKNLLVGTPLYYQSKSGGMAIVLTVFTREDQADLLTVLLRTIIETIQGNKATREIVVTMLANLIIGEGNFGNTALHWGLHFILWVLRVCGTELTMEKFQRLVNFLAWFMPVIRWTLRLFGVVG
jgi:hypothetical protein